jgi:ABC-type proline/glycine betaine transport system substrate-binding protein
VDAFLLKTLIEEKAGWPAQLVAYDQDEAVLQAMQAGAVHIYPEFWRSEALELYDKYVARDTLSSCGPLGVLGRNGLYMQEVHVETWPDLAGWRGLRNNSGAAMLFNHTLVAFMESWGAPSKMLSALALPYFVDYRGASDTEAYIAQKLEDDEPLLFFLWDPHHLLYKFSLNRVQFPVIPGVVPVGSCRAPWIMLCPWAQAYTTEERYTQGLSDYPSDVLVKLSSKNLKTVAPTVNTLLLRFTITNAEQSFMMSSVANDRLQLFAATCAWLKSYPDRWRDWVPQEAFSCEAGHFVVEDGRCEACKPGMFSQPGTSRACTACLPGLFVPNNGSVMCVACDALGDFFQESAGQTACVACAPNTRRYVGLLGAENSTACQCKEGFHQPNGEAGKACEKCPSGYDCKGRLEQPGLASKLLLVVLLPTAHAWPELRAAAGAVSLAVQAANAMHGRPEVRSRFRPLCCSAGIFMKCKIAREAARARTQVKALVKWVECDAFDAGTSIVQLMEAGAIGGVVGPFCSLACESSAYLTSRLNLSQISYSAPGPPPCRAEPRSARV